MLGPGDTMFGKRNIACLRDLNLESKTDKTTNYVIINYKSDKL